MRSLLIIGSAAIALGLAAVGLAAPPPNDAFANATSITSLPFTASVELAEATSEDGEPSNPCWAGARAGTVWFVLRPTADTVITVRETLFGGPVAVYRADGPGIAGATHVACGVLRREAVAPLQAGSTYYVQLSGGAGPAAQGNLLVLAVDPPANDDFAQTAVVEATPYRRGVDLRAATLEPGEPTQRADSGSPLTHTAWFSFTPVQSRSIMVTGTTGCCVPLPNVAVYAGGSLATVVPVATLRPTSAGAIFNASPGTTYAIQLGVSGFPPQSAYVLQVQETPQPEVREVGSTPEDPSIHDTIAFTGHAVDPAGFATLAYAWDFGDGTGAVGASATHRFASDGDYRVVLTVRTPDGRIASAAQTIAVRTHDVGIETISTPAHAKVGHTRKLDVAVVSRTADETVAVTLYRSEPGGGWAQVDQITELVSAHKRGKATSFEFEYTFTAGDAAAGTVTFRAVSQIVGRRDALPADNEATGIPVTVKG